MTLDNVNKDLLMEEPSFNRVPLAPVFLARSLPAKSTMLKFATVTAPLPLCDRLWFLLSFVDRKE